MDLWLGIGLTQPKQTDHFCLCIFGCSPQWKKNLLIIAEMKASPVNKKWKYFQMFNISENLEFIPAIRITHRKNTALNPLTGTFGMQI